jgi:AraC family transcriptional regulator, regulatory protein of adaptative response / DNA-3-methyladenine glycosylase II
MPLDSASCYRALSTHDARFDGRFFVGVRSTRIYCRPVCTARLPRRDNCRFFRSAAAAEVDGYRPCLRCRPELAPGLASVDAPARITHAAVQLIEDGVLEQGGIEALAARIGITSRHLRRVFDAQFGVSPIEYAQTHRLLLAKRLLTDTSLPVIDVALASGFGSVRRFNALIRSRYRMPPSRLRRDAAPASLPQAMRFELAYRPPYDWEALLAFLDARAIAGVERVDARGYHRTLAVTNRTGRSTGWISVSHAPRRHALHVCVSASLARAVPSVLSSVRHAFDLACDPAPILACLGDLAEARPGLRVPGACDGFELAVRAVIGQQVSVAGARTLLGRVATAYGTPLADDCPVALERVFPAAANLAGRTVDDLRAIGLTTARARTLIDLARAVADGAFVLSPGVDVERTCAALESIRGIGRWTSGYIAMRALGWPDAFPDNDLGVLRAMGETRGADARARSEAWRPWRAYAVMHLWNR